MSELKPSALPKTLIIEHELSLASLTVLIRAPDREVCTSNGENLIVWGSDQLPVILAEARTAVTAIVAIYPKEIVRLYLISQLLTKRNIAHSIQDSKTSDDVRNHAWFSALSELLGTTQLTHAVAAIEQFRKVERARAKLGSE